MQVRCQSVVSSYKPEGMFLFLPSAPHNACASSVKLSCLALSIEINAYKCNLEALLYIMFMLTHLEPGGITHGIRLEILLHRVWQRQPVDAINRCSVDDRMSTALVPWDNTHYTCVQK